MARGKGFLLMHVFAAAASASRTAVASGTGSAFMPGTHAAPACRLGGPRPGRCYLSRWCCRAAAKFLPGSRGQPCGVRCHCVGAMPCDGQCPTASLVNQHCRASWPLLLTPCPLQLHPTRSWRWHWRRPSPSCSCCLEASTSTPPPSRRCCAGVSTGFLSFLYFMAGIEAPPASTWVVLDLRLSTHDHTSSARPCLSSNLLAIAFLQSATSLTCTGRTW